MEEEGKMKSHLYGLFIWDKSFLRSILSTHGAYFIFILFAMSNVTCFSFFHFSLSFFWKSMILLSFEIQWRWQDFILDYKMYDFHLDRRTGGISDVLPDIVWLAMDGLGKWSVHNRYFFAKRLNVWKNSTQILSSKNLEFDYVKYVALVNRIHPKGKLGFWIFCK